VAAALGGALNGDLAGKLERRMAGLPDISAPGWLVSQSSRQALADRLHRAPQDVVLAFYTQLPVGGVAAPASHSRWREHRAASLGRVLAHRHGPCRHRPRRAGGAGPMAGGFRADISPAAFRAAVSPAEECPAAALRAERGIPAAACTPGGAAAGRGMRPGGHARQAGRGAAGAAAREATLCRRGVSGAGPAGGARAFHAGGTLIPAPVVHTQALADQSALPNLSPTPAATPLGCRWRRWKRPRA
jgi:hypothetical protein